VRKSTCRESSMGLGDACPDSEYSEILVERNGFMKKR
jgi:hypothetical protein